MVSRVTVRKPREPGLGQTYGLIALVITLGTLNAIVGRIRAASFGDNDFFVAVLNAGVYFIVYHSLLLQQLYVGKVTMDDIWFIWAPSTGCWVYLALGGFGDGFGEMTGFVSQPFLNGILHSVCSQAVLVFTVLFSIIFLRAQYIALEMIGATVAITGVMVALGGRPESGSEAAAQYVLYSTILIVGTSGNALSSVFKEKTYRMYSKKVLADALDPKGERGRGTCTNINQDSYVELDKDDESDDDFLSALNPARRHSNVDGEMISGVCQFATTRMVSNPSAIFLASAYSGEVADDPNDGEPKFFGDHDLPHPKDSVEGTRSVRKTTYSNWPEACRLLGSNLEDHDPHFGGNIYHSPQRTNSINSPQLVLPRRSLLSKRISDLGSALGSHRTSMSYRTRPKLLNVFCISSATSAFEIVWMLPLIISVSMIPNGPMSKSKTIGCLLENGFNCLWNIENAAEECQYAFVSYSLYVCINLSFNISLSLLIRKASAVMGFVALKATIPLTAILFSTIEWPLIGKQQADWHILFALILVLSGVILFRRGNIIKEKMQIVHPNKNIMGSLVLRESDIGIGTRPTTILSTSRSLLHLPEAVVPPMTPQETKNMSQNPQKIIPRQSEASTMDRTTVGTVSIRG